MESDELLGAARQLLDSPALDTRGWWARGAAVLARQALEMHVAQLVAAHGADTVHASFSSQLIALRALIDPALAERTRATWVALSAATHFQAYELPPTAAEVRAWLSVVSDLTRREDLLTAPTHG